MYKKALLPRARELRAEMTKQERRLWYDFLRSHPAHFYKQRVIGRFIVDFYCASAKLVIELDGSQHYAEQGKAYDEDRTRFLQSRGLDVVRIPNNEVDRNFRGVCDYIDSLVRSR